MQTEWTKYLADGSTQFTQNHRLIARDGLGRVFQERRRSHPREARSTPRSGESSSLNPQRIPSRTATLARTSANFAPTSRRPDSAAGRTARESLAASSAKSLGSRRLNGLDLIGTRETQTLNPLVTGSDRPLVVVKEFWYSRQLGLNVLTTRNDPRSGKEVFTVTDIRRGEPDAALFAMPADFRVVDLRAALAR